MLRILSCNYRDSLLSRSIRQEAGCYPNGRTAEKNYNGRIKGVTVKKGSAEKCRRSLFIMHLRGTQPELMESRLFIFLELSQPT